jgi:hypothetical protein
MLSTKPLATYELIPRYMFTCVDTGELIPWLLWDKYELIPLGILLLFCE